MQHPKAASWDRQLKALFDEVAGLLEDRPGGRWRLRRNRPRRGETSHPESDCLFNLGALFTPGFGSELGRGYLVDIVLAAGEDIPAGEREAIEEEALGLIRALLPAYFPGRELTVARDGSRYKIVGDFGLGAV